MPRAIGESCDKSDTGAECSNANEQRETGQTINNSRDAPALGERRRQSAHKKCEGHDGTCQEPNASFKPEGRPALRVMTLQEERHLIECIEDPVESPLRFPFL